MSQPPPTGGRGGRGRARGRGAPMTSDGGSTQRPGNPPPPPIMATMRPGGPPRMPGTRPQGMAPTQAPPPQMMQQQPQQQPMHVKPPGTARAFQRPRPLHHSTLQDLSTAPANVMAPMTQHSHPAAMGRAAVRGTTKGAARPVGAAASTGHQGEAPLESESPRRRDRTLAYQPPVPLPPSATRKALATLDSERQSVVKLLTNYYVLSKRTDQMVIQYRVDFGEVVMDKRRKFRLIRSLNLAKHYLYDGEYDLKMLKELPDEVNNYQARLEDDTPVPVIIKRVAYLAPNHPELCHLYNSQMRRNLSHLQYVQIGRNYFQPRRARRVYNHNVEIWPGLITPIGEHERGILMAVQTTHKFLRTDRVIDVINEQSSKCRGPALHNSLSNMLIGSVVMTKYNNRTYSICDFDYNQNPLSTFQLKNGQTISYKDYYEKQYNLRIKNTDQFLLVAESKERESKITRVEKKKVNLIPELCCLTGLSDQQRQDFRFMREVAKITRLGPSDRVNELHTFMNEMNANNEVSEEMTSWNLKFEPSPLMVDGHRLPRETVLVGNNQNCTPNDETMDFNLVTRGKLYDPKQISKWAKIAPISILKNCDKLTTFFRELGIVSSSMGFHITEAQTVPVQDDRVVSYLNVLNKPEIQGFEMLLIILPSIRTDTYQAVKKFCVQELGIPSQILCATTINRVKNSKSLATKVALQMCCKVGGIPWHLSIPFKSLMVVGYDTYHCAKIKGTSMGALVTSIDPNVTRWYSQGRKHSHTGAGEISNSMSAMMMCALKHYYSKNGRFPDTIFYYRDGVGEGQIKNVLEAECKMVQEAYSQLNPNEALKMIYCVVNKRINTRYFGPAKDGLPYSNPLPGTVLDKDITKKNRFDFFLVSQSVSQGTVSPTSYYVVEDTTTIPGNRIQRMTYKLTHLYFNWTGTISVPAPCQYAHKLAFLLGQGMSSENIHHNLKDKLFFL